MGGEGALRVLGKSYDVFVSYRHAEPDRTWAHWVVETVETYRVPRRLVREHGLPRCLGKAFLDEQELSAGPELEAEIKRRLEASRSLVVVCSPASRGRPWIEREVSLFQQWGRGARVLPLLVGGEPATALPEALLSAAAHLPGSVPLAADVRPRPGESERDVRRRAALQLLAPLLGVDYDELRRRDDQRRHRRWAWLSGALGLVVVLLGVLAAWALASNARATERLVALHEEQGRQALLAGSPGQALVHLVEAYERGGRSASLRFMLARATQALQQPAVVLSGHSQAVHGASFSPDGALVATGCDDGSVRLWEAQGGRERVRLAAQGAPVRSVVFSPDGRYLLASGGDNTLRAYEVGSGRIAHEFRGNEAPGSPPDRSFLLQPVFVRDSSRFVVVGCCQTRLLADLGDGTARRLELPADGKAARKVGGTDYDWGSAVRADGALVATADQGGWIRLHAAADLRYLCAWKAHVAKLVGLAFLPGSGDLISAGEDGRLCRWAAAGCLETGTEPARIWQVEADRSLLASFALQRSGELCATGGLGGDARVWRTQDGTDLHEPSRHGSRVNALEFDPAGEVLLSASADSTACLWDVRSGRRLAVMQGHDGGILSATFAPDGATFVTTSSDGTARIWSRPPRPSGRRFAADGTAEDFALLDGGLGLVTRGTDGTVQLLRLEDGEKRQRLEGDVRAPPQAVACAGVRVLACTGDGWVYEWDASRPDQPLRERRLAHAGLSRLAFASDGSLLSTGYDGQLRVEAAVDQSIRTVVTSAQPLVVLELSADCRRAAVGGLEGAVWLWDVGAPAGRLLHRGHRAHVQALVVSRDGRYVLSGGRDRLAILWDVEQDRQVALLRGHEAEISDVDIDRQGHRAVTAGDDGSVRLWTLANGSLERALDIRDGHRRDAHVRFHPSGELLLTWGADQTLRIWSVETGRLLYVLEGHTSPVGSVTFVAGGAGALSNDGNGSLWSWDLSLESRAASVLRGLVARYVPWHLDAAGRLVPRR